MNGRIRVAPRLESRRTAALVSHYLAGDLLAAENLMLPLTAYDEDGVKVDGVTKVAATVTGATSSGVGKLQRMNFWQFSKNTVGEASWALAHAHLHALLDPTGPPSRRSLLFDDYVQAARFGASGQFAVGFIDNITAGDFSTLTGIGFLLRSGSNLAALSRAGWTLSASASGGGAVGNAVDGNNGSRWATGGVIVPGTSFFRIRLASAAEVVQLVLNDSSFSGDVPKSGKMQYSDDGGVTWHDAATWSTATDLAGGILTKAWASVGSHLDWQLLATDVANGAPSNWWSIGEINLYVNGGGPAPDGRWHCFVKEAAAGFVAPVTTLYDLDTGVAGNYDSTSDVAAAVANLHRLSILISGPDKTAYFYIDGALVGRYAYSAAPGRLGGAAGTPLQYKLFAASGDNQMMRMLWGGSHGLYRVHEAAL